LFKKSAFFITSSVYFRNLKITSIVDFFRLIFEPKYQFLILVSYRHVFQLSQVRFYGKKQQTFRCKWSRRSRTPVPKVSTVVPGNPWAAWATVGPPRRLWGSRPSAWPWWTIRAKAITTSPAKLISLQQQTQTDWCRRCKVGPILYKYKFYEKSQPRQGCCMYI